MPSRILKGTNVNYKKNEKEKYVKFEFSVEGHEAEMYYYIFVFTSFIPLSNFENKI